MALVDVLSQLSIAGYKCVLTAWYPLKNIIPKIFDHHLLPALHVFNYDCLDSMVGVVLQRMLVFHDTSSAFLVLHLDEDCAKDGLIGVGGLGRDLPDSLNNVSINIDTWSTDLG